VERSLTSVKKVEFHTGVKDIQILNLSWIEESISSVSNERVKIICKNCRQSLSFSVTITQHESGTSNIISWSVTVFNKNLSSQYNLTAQIEQVSPIDKLHFWKNIYTQFSNCIWADYRSVYFRIYRLLAIPSVYNAWLY
jgi:hypothetical protein